MREWLTEGWAHRGWLTEQRLLLYTFIDAYAKVSTPDDTIYLTGSLIRLRSDLDLTGPETTHVLA